MFDVLKKLLPGNLKSKLRKLLIGYDIPTYHFSASGEDLILLSLFSDILKTDIKKHAGVYADVGAYDPVKCSNTYLFYINGWSGINIDPRPGSKKSFDELRPRDINLEIGIAAEEGMLTYYYLGESSTMNTFSKAYLEMNGVFQYVQKEIPVQTYKLSTIFEKHLNGRQLDLLNVDAEGLDLEILRSNDWNKFRPKVICVELSPVYTLQDILENEAYTYLNSLNYSAVAKNYIIEKVSSVIFVDDTFRK